MGIAPLEFLPGEGAERLDLGRDFVGKHAAEMIVPRIIDRIAIKMGSEVAEKWAGRLVPVISAGFAATTRASPASSQARCRGRQE